jgi:hypothetical protein
MLHDDFQNVTKKLNTFLEKNLEAFYYTNDRNRSFAILLTFRSLGGAFMSVAQDHGILPDGHSERDMKELTASVKTLAEDLDKEQGMDDVDFRSDIQNTVNKLAANGISLTPR